MVGAQSFLALLCIVGFLAAAWGATRISRLVGFSSIVLEIAVGIVLGPSLAKLVAPEYAVCQHARRIDCSVPSNFAELVAQGRPLGEGLGMVADIPGLCPRELYLRPTSGSIAQSVQGQGQPLGADAAQQMKNEVVSPEEEQEPAVEAEPQESGNRRLAAQLYRNYEECLSKNCELQVSNRCQLTPAWFTLIGHMGVLLTFFEIGLHFNLEKAALVNIRAGVPAVVGTFLPFITGALLMMAYGRPFAPDGIVVGTALCPSSVGVVMRLFGDAKVLQEDFAQVAVASSYLDLLISILTYNVVFTLRGPFNGIDTILLPAVALVCLPITMWLGVKVLPQLINEVILPRVPARPGLTKMAAEDEALFFIMMALMVGWATAMHYTGTHLWGCLIAGMAFSSLETADKGNRALQVWVKQTKRAVSWFIRVFFAAAVGFAIPAEIMFDWPAFWRGTLMGLGPCILTKLVSAPQEQARFTVGWALVGRGEFAYLIAQMGYGSNLINARTFSITIWALLYANVIAPFVSRQVLQRYVQQHLGDRAREDEAEEAAQPKGGMKESVDLLGDRN